MLETVVSFRAQFEDEGFAVEGCSLDSLLGSSRELPELLSERVIRNCLEPATRPTKFLVVDSLTQNEDQGRVWLEVYDGSVSYREEWRLLRRARDGSWAVGQVTRSGWVVADGRGGGGLTSIEDLATIATLVARALSLPQVSVDVQPAIVLAETFRAPSVVRLPRGVLEERRRGLRAQGVEAADLLPALQCFAAAGLRLPGLETPPGPDSPQVACTDLPAFVVVVGKARVSIDGDGISVVIPVFGVGNRGVGLFNVILGREPQIRTVVYVPR